MDFKLPTIGLGTYQLYEETYYSVLEALKLGYTHIDTASLYKNEEQVGKAIKDSQVTRGNIFITTKIWNTDIKKGPKRVENAFFASLKRLCLEYVDMVLLHNYIPNHSVGAFKTLQSLKDQGFIRFIGVSNYSVKSLVELKENHLIPYVNQIELSPFCKQEDIVQYCKKENIIIMAHSCMTKGHKFNHPVILQCSKSLSISPAELLLHWAIWKGYCVLCRSSNVRHLKMNMETTLKITITKEIIEKLDMISQTEQYCTHNKSIT